MDDNLVQVVGAATWSVCAALTSVGQVTLQASLDRACAIPGRMQLGTRGSRAR